MALVAFFCIECEEPYFPDPDNPAVVCDKCLKKRKPTVQ